MYHGRETLHFAGVIDIGSEILSRRAVTFELPGFILARVTQMRVPSACAL